MADTAAPTDSNTTTGASTRRDEHQNPITGQADAVALYDAAIDDLVRFHVDVIDKMRALTDQHPTFAMGDALAAYLHLMSTDPNDLAAARSFASGLSSHASNDRERAHDAAVSTWLAGDWHGSARILDDLLVRWPADVLALMIGHQLDFFLGDARNLRDRVGRSLVAFDPQHPHQGFVRGMQAFGLEEAGHYEAAREAGLEALGRNPDDVWAVHAVAHVYEMQGRVDEGIDHLRSRVEDWGDGNLLTVHNWWHFALYLLERHLHDEVLNIYDTRIHHDASDGVPLELLDASALLWRLHLDGVDTGGRFGQIADAWAASRGDHGSWYAFNDVHAVMAFVGDDRRGDARAAIDRLRAAVAAPGTDPDQPSNRRMVTDVGLPASEALVAFAEERYQDAVDLLWPARRTFHHFGGSHAQRDVLERTLVEAALCSGQGDLADRLLAERLARRPTGAFALDRLASGTTAAAH